MEFPHHGAVVTCVLENAGQQLLCVLLREEIVAVAVDVDSTRIAARQEGAATGRAHRVLAVGVRERRTLLDEAVYVRCADSVLA